MKCGPNRYYQILEVKNPCTKEESKKAYKKLSLLLHPNKNKYEDAEETFKRRQHSMVLLEATRDPLLFVLV
jgi:curved DNA-binding protein CbpA